MDQFFDFCSCDGVECAGRFIHEENFRIDGQGTWEWRLPDQNAYTTRPIQTEIDIARAAGLGTDLLAADVVAQAIVRAATQATGIPGYPAARDLGRQ